MRKSTLRLYMPFLALIAAQALLITFLPSNGAKQQVAAANLTNGGAAATGTGQQAAAADTGAAVPGAAVDTSGGGGAVSGAVGDATGAVTGATEKVGSTAHCKGTKQFAILVNANPPCVPKFAGNNGGSTYQGVTKDKVKVIFFSSKPNEQVDAILATQGLAVSAADSNDYDRVALAFIKKHYELYGRQIDAEWIQGDCPTTPPNYDTCNAEAQAVVQKHPFIVVWGTPLYGSVFDIWAKAGIISLGGWQFDDSLFNTRRPYRYDPYMNGTEIGAHVAEYYCKKLAKSPADHSGAVIHPTIGARGKVPRKLGIVTPEIEANTLAAKRVIAAVQKCGGQVTGSPYTYESDIEKATQQTTATVSKLIQDKVTTVACMCDPIAPAFLTKGMTADTYFPEFLLAGTQFIDADLVGRLYDQQQMKHAFGVSSLPAQDPLDQADASRVWQDGGRAGHPCGKNGCGINWGYVNLLGTALQMAGPNLTPLTFEKGLLTMPADGGWAANHKADLGLWKFGANDYTWLSDAREVYWSPSAVSPVDGQQGAYVATNGGQRYTLGQWTAGFSVPVEPN
jgi:hypothetical protein